MSLSAEIKKRVEGILSQKFETLIKIVNDSGVSGGNINKTYKIDTTENSFFVKINHASEFPGMFEAEMHGLNLLTEKSKFKIPSIIAFDIYKDNSILILEYVSPESKKKDFFSSFGIILADLHRNTQSKFGLEKDNYIGSLKQSNKMQSDWISFLIEERLEKQLKLAVDNSNVGNEFSRNYEKIYKKLNELIPLEIPALIHGDLWSGNYMVAENDAPCIFDPAVYYGHREMDIAMTKLFGGFPEEFYRSYNDAFPMEKEWEKRTDVYNLYPLMVHVNLFGGDYVESVKRIIKKFI
jgi:protein-ribulosamine 3-kinase